MTHDIRNKLLNIQGYANILKTKYDKALHEKTVQLTKSMNDLLRRLLLLADAGLVIEKTDNVDLTELIRSVADSAIPTSVKFIYDNLPIVKCDREKVAQIFQNFFENAVTHGEPSKIEVRQRDSEDSTGILIVNDGKPIPLEHLQKSFSAISLQKRVAED